MVQTYINHIHRHNIEIKNIMKKTKHHHTGVFVGDLVGNLVGFFFFVVGSHMTSKRERHCNLKSAKNRNITHFSWEFSLIVCETYDYKHTTPHTQHIKTHEYLFHTGLFVLITNTQHHVHNTYINTHEYTYWISININRQQHVYVYVLYIICSVMYCVCLVNMSKSLDQIDVRRHQIQYACVFLYMCTCRICVVFL